MKKLYTIVAAILLTSSIFAQAPEKMSYQAVIRDGSDALLVGKTVGMQISIVQGSALGTAVYVETQTPTTNINGLVTIEIGTGITSDVFSAIDWATGPYFIKTETDALGGSSYTITGTSQLLSVPYALYAKTSGTPNYKGTSTTSINLTTFGDCTSYFYPGCASGTASLTTTTELNYTPGMRIRLLDTANPTTNYFEGIIQTYDGTNMTIAIDTSFGTGTYSSWDINLGNGLTGVPGPLGENGQSAAECFDYTFDSSTSTSPFDGALRFNSTDLSTATQIYIHNNDINSSNQVDYFNLIAPNLSTIKGTIMVSQDNFGTNNGSLFAIINVTDNTGYQTLDVSYLSGATTPFNDFNPIAVCFGRTGDKGDAGGVSASNSLRLSYLQANHIDIGKDLESSLVANIDATSTSLSITYPSNGFPSQPGILIVGDEQIYYQFYWSSGVYNFDNVIRGYNGTTATSHNAGDTVYSTNGKIVLNEDGTMKVQELSIGYLSYPTDEGLPNQVLTTNGFDQASWSDLNTSFVSEGSNLYYTNTRVDARITSQKGNANGLATLDGSGKVPASQLNISSVAYQGTWNANINSPALSDGIGIQGHYYVISASGSTNLDGITDWNNGDWVIFNGTAWEKADHTDQVTSVAGKQGAVSLVSSDITDLSTTTVSEGTNLYYTDTRADNRISVQKGSANGVATLDGSGKIPTSQLSAPTISNNMVSSTSTNSTTSTVYTVINSMTITPVAGTYMVSFSASGNSSSSTSSIGYSIFNNGIIIGDSERNFMNGGTALSYADFSLHTQSIVTVNGSQTIDVRVKTTSGIFTVNARNMILLKLN